MLTLTGPAVVLLEDDEAYAEPGFTALDARDGDLASAVEVEGLEALEAGRPGDYLLTYRVTNSAGVAAAPRSRLVRAGGERALQSARPFGSTSSELAYYEHLPKDYGLQPEARYPVLIYNHGWGHSRQLQPELSFELGGVARILDAGDWDDSRPLIVLSPQRFEAEVTATEIARLHQFMAYALETYAVDPERVYMGGFSDGSYISWQYAQTYPTDLAALVSIAGGGQINCDIADLAVWAFHGLNDTVVPVSIHHGTVQRLNACEPAERALFTLFPEGRHDHALERAVLAGEGLGTGDSRYDTYDRDIYGWLLQYSRARP
ncbi:immunoglobulin-like domain-containing protein [Sorangium sp. So ce321]|uniref:immunoglobulin-like domain-containing protein n=1 Tax=Sorangium sp. So ce321 TaxID=3133300 RepID=UPI003F5D99B3